MEGMEEEQRIIVPNKQFEDGKVTCTSRELRFFSKRKFA